MPGTQTLPPRKKELVQHTLRRNGDEIYEKPAKISMFHSLTD